MSRDLAVLAHELRTPVAALDAIVETFATHGARLSEGQRRRFVELAVAAMRDIERLLDPTPPAAVAVDVGVVVDDVVDAAAAGGDDVRAEVEAGLSPIIGDPARLRQALRNLVENAIAHGPPVLVAARALDGDIAIAVTDVGDGIAVEDQHRIFEPGVRLTDERPGSGIGLSVVREVVDELGGRIEVASTPGQGATITLVLPPASASG